MENIYNTVIQGTIFGSVVGIIIFVLKSTVLKRLPAKWQYWLWSVMIIKLIFPKGPESSISIFNQIKVSGIVSEGELLKIAQRAAVVNISIKNTFNILPYVWITGFAVVLLWSIISFITLNYKIRSSASADKNTLEIFDHCKKVTGVKRSISIVVQNHISTTALCGIFRPRILITTDFEKSNQSHIEHTFIHELSHYKRGDVAVNYLLLFLSCVHWFNPVVWFLFRKIRRDTEIATDERTMLYLNPDEHKSYGMTLIDTVAEHSVKSQTILGIANNKQDIKKRIRAISSFKKPNLIQHFSGVLTIILIASVCLTSAVIAKPITNMIYESIPEVIITDNKQSITQADVVEKIAEDTAELPDTEEDIPVVTETTEVINNSEIEDISINSIISSTGQSIHDGADATDMNTSARLIDYNSDSKDKHSFVIKPNTDGSVQILAEEQSSYNYMIPVEISNTKTPGYGWMYGIYPNNNMYIDGLDPNEEYIVTIETYCPGYYGINGRILIY